MIGKPLELDVYEGNSGVIDVTQRGYRVAWDDSQILKWAFHRQITNEATREELENNISTELEDDIGYDTWRFVSTREEAIERAIMLAIEYKGTTCGLSSRTVLTLPGSIFGKTFGTAFYNHTQAPYHRPYNVRELTEEEILSGFLKDDPLLDLDALIYEPIRHWDCQLITDNIEKELIAICEAKDATLIRDFTHSSFGLASELVNPFNDETVRRIDVLGRGIAQYLPIALFGYSSEHFSQEFQPEVGWDENLFLPAFSCLLEYYIRNSHTIGSMSKNCELEFENIFDSFPQEIVSNIYGTMIAVKLGNSVRKVVEDLATQNIIVTDHTPWLRFSPVLTNNPGYYTFLAEKIAKAISNSKFYQEIQDVQIS